MGIRWDFAKRGFGALGLWGFGAFGGLAVFGSWVVEFGVLPYTLNQNPKP